MPNSIEIYENTLLKLVIRKGTNNDRLNVVFSDGELVYTTDTKELYVGDGATLGGKLVGRSFFGSSSDITTLAPVSENGLAFDSDNNRLYRLSANDGSLITDWELIGGVYSAGDDTITIDSSNNITVNVLSSSNLHSSIVKTPLYFDSGSITLSANIEVDTIAPKTLPSLVLYPSLSVNGVNYNFPSSSTVGGFLRVENSSGDLVWDSIPLSAVSTNSITVNLPLTSTANGVDSTGTAVNPLTANIVIGTHPMLSSYNIWARWSATSNTMISNVGIASITRNSKGNYTVTYDTTLPTLYPYVNVQIVESNVKSYTARATNISNTSCDVEIYAYNNVFLTADADFAIKIET